MISAAAVRATATPDSPVSSAGSTNRQITSPLKASPTSAKRPRHRATTSTSATKTSSSTSSGPPRSVPK